MHDPHVEWLRFTIEPGGDHVSYDNPSRLQFTNDLGQFDAADGGLVVTLADHFPDIDAAREVIDGFLRSWEIAADLDHGPGTVKFTYKDARVIDRNPPSGHLESVVLSAVGGVYRVGSAHALTHVRRRAYPDPPESFDATVDVQRAYSRWRQYKQGREPLQSMAYYVLTIALSAGGRSGATKAYNVHLDVLRKISELTSTKGDEATIRKAPEDGQCRPLSRVEQVWLEGAVKRLIKQFGKHASGKHLDQVTMRDLPELPAEATPPRGKSPRH